MKMHKHFYNIGPRKRSQSHLHTNICDRKISLLVVVLLYDTEKNKVQFIVLFL